MFSLSFLCVYLTGASLILLLPAESQYEFTAAPDYDSDYNATFEYSFYSNASSEELDKFSERFVEPEEGEEDDQEVTVTVATARSTTEQSGVDVHNNASSLPVSLEMRTLIWTLMIVMSLNTQQLQHTL